MSGRPPVSQILALAAAEMVERQAGQLDDLLASEINRLGEEVNRLEAMDEQVRAIVSALRESTVEVDQNARESLADQWT